VPPVFSEFQLTLDAGGLPKEALKVFAQMLLVNFTNNCKETASNTLN